MLVFIVGYAAIVEAQEIVAPVDVQYYLFLKTMTYDRKLQKRVGDQMVVGILYQREFKHSLNFKDELIKVIDGSGIEEIEGIPLRFVPVDLSADPDLDSSVTKHELDAFYVAPLRGYNFQTITALSRAKKITTFAAVPEDIESGLSVGIDRKNEKPLVVINLSAAKAEGCDFDSELLKLARVIP